jgi:adenosylhomocysteine nucleosidase
MLAIMSATPEESAAVVAALSARQTREKGRRLYQLGILHGIEVVVVFSRWGKVAAAATATQLIDGLGVTQLVFSGVAGAVRTDLAIGDVVIGTELIQHDMDATPLFARYEIPLLGQSTFATDLGLRADLAVAAQAFVRDDLTVTVSANVRELFGIGTPRIVHGIIASGDQFFSGASRLAELRQRLPEISCVDMESAAVAQVCTEYGVPFAIVRTISDSADDNASHDFPRFSREIAGQYSLGIVTALLRERSRRLARANH